MQHSARLHTAWCLIGHGTAAFLAVARIIRIISWYRQAADAKQDVLRKPGVLAATGCEAPGLEDNMQLDSICNIPNTTAMDGSNRRFVICVLFVMPSLAPICQGPKRVSVTHPRTRQASKTGDTHNTFRLSSEGFS